MHMFPVGRVCWRMLWGSDCGALAKARRALEDTPGSACAWSGTVGTVRVVPGDEGQLLCEKQVKPATRSAVREEAAALRALATLSAWVTPRLAASLQATADDLEAEIDMRTERARAEALRAAVEGDEACGALRIEAVRPHLPRCTADTFAYEYVPGAPLGRGVDRCVVQRYVCGFFSLMHRAGVLLLDPSPSNALLRLDGTLVLIDAGAARAMTPAERAIARRLHLADTEGEVRAALGGDAVDGTVARMVWRYTEPFWCSRKEFPPVDDAVALVASVRGLSSELPPSAAGIARAVFGMVRAVQQLGFNAMDTRPFMLEIRALYSQPQSHSSSPSCSVTMTSSSSAGR